MDGEDIWESVVRNSKYEVRGREERGKYKVIIRT